MFHVIYFREHIFYNIVQYYCKIIAQHSMTTASGSTCKTTCETNQSSPPQDRSIEFQRSSDNAEHGSDSELVPTCGEHD